MNIYDELKKIGAEIVPHESDFYTPITKESDEIIKMWVAEFPIRKSLVKKFLATDKRMHYELIFQYTPFFEAYLHEKS